MSELRTQMRNMLLAAARDPDNRDVYLEAWLMFYTVRIKPTERQKMIIIQENLVKEDQDCYWVYGGGKIRCVGDDSEEGGYTCSSFEDGIELLIDYGYIER